MNVSSCSTKTPEAKMKGKDEETYWLIYAFVGKSFGSQPILIASLGWYTRIQSTRIFVGNVRWSVSTKPPKLVDMPRFMMRYYQNKKRLVSTAL